MGWLTKPRRAKESKDVSSDMWTICPSCKAHIFKAEWKASLKVCPKCNYHDRITAGERLKLLMDEGSFQELFKSVTAADPLGFKDAKGSYADKAEAAVKKTGSKEAVISGHGRIEGHRAAISVMDFQFLGGSLGSGAGEKILLGAEYALKHKVPYIVISASGGARMHEGIVSLMQMAKTCAGIARLRHAGIPYFSILTNPTFGGVSASFAMVGDLNIAEPGAVIGFAGRRVIEQTIKQKLPKDFQTAEYLLEHGFIDKIVSRTEMKTFLGTVLTYAGAAT